MNPSIWCGILAAVLSLGWNGHRLSAQDDLVGTWQLRLKHEQVEIRCGLELAKRDQDWTATLINGDERIPIDATVGEKSIELEIAHYDSKIRMDVVRVEHGTPIANGFWRKRRGPDEWVQMAAQAVLAKKRQSDPEAAEQFAGRWEVKFSESEEPAVGIFRAAEDGRMEGTFLTTTGDYRFLAGSAVDRRMSLSCFDGAHAFSFEARLNDSGEIEGDFWSANTWHETFTATRNEQAVLPDSFRQTLVNQDAKLSDFEFPDVNGKPINLDAEVFRGNPRLIYIFGSWCPNCHDAAAYLSELEQTYASRGLSILGLAFELTGEFARDAEQVKRYLARHQCNYPVLIAGTSDKTKATRTFPLLDRVRSYPTTIFVDRTGKITAVHTGFSGPATGNAFLELKEKFQQQIESLLTD
ncbi:MAG: TlpA disulfide reductase family protein [Planctomycetota bacterium]